MHVPAGQYLFFTAANFISKIRRQFSKFVKIREFREIFFPQNSHSQSIMPVEIVKSRLWRRRCGGLLEIA